MHCEGVGHTMHVYRVGKSRGGGPAVGQVLGFGLFSRVSVGKEGCGAVPTNKESREEGAKAAEGKAKEAKRWSMERVGPLFSACAAQRGPEGVDGWLGDEEEQGASRRPVKSRGWLALALTAQARGRARGRARGCRLQGRAGERRLAGQGSLQRGGGEGGGARLSRGRHAQQ